MNLSSIHTDDIVLQHKKFNTDGGVYLETFVKGGAILINQTPSNSELAEWGEYVQSMTVTRSGYLFKDEGHRSTRKWG